MRTVNTTQVLANRSIGRETAEEEQGGKKRAGYGSELSADLAVRLTADCGSGYGADNMELSRRLYVGYPRLLSDEISDAMRRKSGGLARTDANSETVRWHFYVLQNSSATPLLTLGERLSMGWLSPTLTWMHDRTLLSVSRT